MKELLLEIKGLSTYFHMQEGLIKAVDGLNFFLERGKTLGIVGESGCGKTVTALSIMGLVPKPRGKVENGEVLFKGQDLLAFSESEMRKIRGRKIAMIFQDPMTSLNPVFSIGWQLMEAIKLDAKITKAEAKKIAIENLNKVGLPKAEERFNNYPHQFSGGMRQRVMIAMAISCCQDILIADEPTTALDVTIQAQILELLKKLQKETGISIILITHDLGIIANMADWVLVMYAGKQIEYASALEIFNRPRHPYTWGLLQSIPRHDIKKSERLRPIPGQPPSLMYIPNGCSFHPRCEYSKDICRKETPPLVKVSKKHFSACHFSKDPTFKPKKLGK